MRDKAVPYGQQARTPFGLNPKSPIQNPKSGAPPVPIDPSKALGASISGGSARWDKDKVILYHLGVGAGVPQTLRARTFSGRFSWVMMCG